MQLLSVCACTRLPVLLLVDSTMLVIFLWANLLKVWISLPQLLESALLPLFNLATSSICTVVGFKS